MCGGVAALHSSLAYNPSHGVYSKTQIGASALCLWNRGGITAFQPCGRVGKTDSASVLKYTYTAVIRTIQKQIKTGRREVPNPQKDLVDVQQMRYGTTGYVMKLREILNSCFATQFDKMK